MGLGVGERLFSFSLRKTFSTSTMASSTNSPMAMANPPSVKVLMDISKALKTIAEITNDKGMAVRVIMVVRKLSKNKNRIITTRINPSLRASSTFFSELTIKFFCWKILGFSFTSLGSVLCNSKRAFSTSSVNWTVLAPGCFSTVKITAGLALILASPRLSAEPNFTSATCESITGKPSLFPTTVWAKSANVLALPTFLISTSEPNRLKKLPVVFWLVSNKALSISSIDRLNCLNLSLETNTWYCLRSPPMGITCDTPLILINLLRIVKSARVRKSAGLVVSLLTPINIIWPMTELIGPMTGVIPLGSWTVCNFSATNCLAR